MKAAGKEAPAACVRVAQMGEKTKLNMTCTLQVLRKRALENAWSWQTAETAEETDGRLGSIDVAELERREASFAAAARPPPTVAAPSFANGNFRKACAEHPGDDAACACAQAARAAEPTRGDFEGAVAEATRALEEAVRGINDALEELRYELEDEE